MSADKYPDIFSRQMGTIVYSSDTRLAAACEYSHFSSLFPKGRTSRELWDLLEASEVQDLLFVWFFLFIYIVCCYRFKLKAPSKDFYDQDRDSEDEVNDGLLNFLHYFVLNCCYFCFLKTILTIKFGWKGL